MITQKDNEVKANNKRLAKNTIILYFRMLFSMGVSLYTSRVVLNTLGVEDFGIYNVVSGVITMFSIVSGSLSSATQRFITFELGKNENKKLAEVFSTTIIVHMLLAIVILILAETVGVWFLNTHMNINFSRMNAANWIYQCFAISFLISLICIPYNAAIIAHERMKAFAYIGISEVLLKLAAVMVLPLLAFDKLKVYAIFMTFITIFIQFLYRYYCNRNFKGCEFKFFWNRQLFSRIMNFAGWNFIGVSSSVLTTQGVNILLNIFYGVVVNAAQGIALQVQGAITGFINNFMTALNPQITKSYASNDHEYMIRLVTQGARFSFYLMFFLSMPVLIETQSILKLWLKVVPNYAVDFVRLTLVLSISQTLSNTLITAMLATGNIKNYQIIVGGIQMLNLPFAFIALKFGFPPQYTLIIAIILSFVCFLARLYLLKGMINLSVINYLLHVVVNVIVVVIFSAVFPVIIYFFMNNGFLRLFFVCCTCVVSTAMVIYIIGFSKTERMFVNRTITSLRERYGLV